MPKNANAWFQRGPGIDRWKPIRQLRRFDEVVNRLKEGQSPDYIARLIQEEMKECTDLEPLALSNLLRQYRADVIQVVAVDDGTKETPGLDAALKEKVNLYEHYTFLVNAQSWRVKRALVREGKQQGMLANLYRDLDVLRQTLKDFADFQMETGLVRRQPVHLDATLKSESSSVSMSVLLNADAATRNEARAATQQLVKLLSEPQSIDVDSSAVDPESEVDEGS